MRGRWSSYHHCRTNLQDTVAESKEPVKNKPELTSILRFGFVFPFVSINEIPRARHDGMENPRRWYKTFLIYSDFFMPDLLPVWASEGHLHKFKPYSIQYSWEC